MAVNPEDDIEQEGVAASFEDATDPMPEGSDVDIEDDDEVRLGGTRSKKEEDAREESDKKDQEKKKKGMTATHLGRYGIRSFGDDQDDGGWLRIRGKGPRNRQTGQREITDKQLRMLLMTAIIDKGFDETLYIYRGRKPDSQLTSRARTMLMVDAGLLTALEARGIKPPQVVGILGEKPPSWVKSKYGTKMHEWAYKRQTNEMTRDRVRALRAAEWQAKNFKQEKDALTEETKNDPTLSERIRAKRLEELATLPPLYRPMNALANLGKGLGLGLVGMFSGSAKPDQAQADPGADPAADPAAEETVTADAGTGTGGGKKGGNGGKPPPGPSAPGASV